MEQNRRKMGLVLAVLVALLVLICVALNFNFDMFGNKETASSDAVSFSCVGGFYSEDLEIKLKNRTGNAGKIYYTLDGSEPDENSNKYVKAISLEAGDADFPTGYCLRAVVVFADGGKSPVCSRNYICGSGAENRFSTYVICVSGSPEELTEAPDGILCEENIENRGRETERKVNVQLFDSSGQSILNQDCGVRSFGGASRHHYIKSIKLFARKEYDSEKRFALDIFHSSDSEETVGVNQYKKLVLRNCGNDYNFSYIRDELVQSMAYDAGYRNCEGVVPAVYYLNGSYSGLLWLHENYCDELLKERAGENPQGNFVLIEGGESEMTDGDDDEVVQEFNTRYGELASLDMTKDENYQELCEFIDVEDYLDYFAYNLYINNFDWPFNNNKAYKYVPAKGEKLNGEDYDGRWRFLMHDMDWSLGWDEFSSASYDNFARYFEEGSSSPLFSALMKRSDCRERVINKLNELMATEFEPDNALAFYHAMDESRAEEQAYYQKWLEENEVYEEGDWGPDYDHYLDRCEQIEIFLRERPEYIEKFIEQYLKD